MMQDPTKLSTLLTSLKGYTKEAATFIFVRDGSPRAFVIGVDDKGKVTFHASAESFTRTIAEAHDHGRKILAKGGGQDGDQVAANPDLAEAAVAEPQEDAARSDLDSDALAASIVSQISACRAYCGTNVPAIAEKLFDEIINTAHAIATRTKNADLAEIELFDLGRISDVAAALPQIEAKLADAKTELRMAGEVNLAALDYVDAAIELSEGLMKKVFGEA